MAVKFCSASASASDANTRPKHFEEAKVWSFPEPALVRGVFSNGMNPSVQDIYRVEECGGPKLGIEGGAVEKGTNGAGDGLIPAFSGAVLLGSVGTGRFNNVTMAALYLGYKVMTTG